MHGFDREFATSQKRGVCFGFVAVVVVVVIVVVCAGTCSGGGAGGACSKVLPVLGVEDVRRTKSNTSVEPFSNSKARSTEGSTAWRENLATEEDARDLMVGEEMSGILEVMVDG